MFDVVTGTEILNNERAHGDQVTDLQLSLDQTYFITSSKDKAARVGPSTDLIFRLLMPLSSCMIPKLYGF